MDRGSMRSMTPSALRRLSREIDHAKLMPVYETIGLVKQAIAARRRFAGLLRRAVDGRDIHDCRLWQCRISCRRGNLLIGTPKHFWN